MSNLCIKGGDKMRSEKEIRKKLEEALKRGYVNLSPWHGVSDKNFDGVVEALKWVLEEE